MSGAGQIAALREGRSSVGAALARLSQYILSNRRYYTLWSLITLGYVGTFLAVPLLTGQVVEAITEKQSAQKIVQLSLALAAVGAVGGLLRYYSRVLVFNAARTIEYQIRQDLFAHLQRLPQSFYFGWRTGDLMSRCVNDLNSVRMLLGHPNMIVRFNR